MLLIEAKERELIIMHSIFKIKDGKKSSTF